MLAQSKHGDALGETCSPRYARIQDGDSIVVVDSEGNAADFGKLVPEDRVSEGYGVGSPVCRVGNLCSLGEVTPTGCSGHFLE